MPDDKDKRKPPTRRDDPDDSVEYIRRDHYEKERELDERERAVAERERQQSQTGSRTHQPLPPGVAEQQVPAPQQTTVLAGPLGVGMAAGERVVTGFAKLSNAQLVNVLLGIAFLVGNGVLIYLVHEAISDRKDERRAAADLTQTAARVVEEGREKDRQFFSKELELGRLDRKASTEMILSHCAQENAKRDKVINDLTAWLSKWFSTKKMPDSELGAATLPTAAPMPRVKGDPGGGP